MAIRKRGNRIDFTGADARRLAMATMPKARRLMLAQEAAKATAPINIVPRETKNNQ